MTTAVALRPELPPEMEGWAVARWEEIGHTDGRSAMYLQLEKLMPDGTWLRFEATLHNRDEIRMLLPIILATQHYSTPDLRLKVNRTKISGAAHDQVEERYRRRLSEQHL